MASFNNTTFGYLLVGAAILGGGIWYQAYATRLLDDSQKAVRQVDAAITQAAAKKQLAQQYVSLNNSMEAQRIDRQEPMAMQSEFTPEEVTKVGQLLVKLYERDGHFFLERFVINWRGGNERLGKLPRVGVELKGRKVLLFSNDQAGQKPSSTGKL